MTKIVQNAQYVAYMPNTPWDGMVVVPIRAIGGGYYDCFATGEISKADKAEWRSDHCVCCVADELRELHA